MRRTLRTQEEFKRVFDAGRYITKRNAVLSVLVLKQPDLRYGILVRRKVGNAVFRNKVRRQLREIFREGLQLMGWQGHFVLSVTRDFAELAYAEKKSYLCQIIQNATAKQA
ncbi:MAG: ribonuclease P protein component [Candidatus Cloacimonetes bacterium]|nr:ribonuclease P protein component [Candidatus Cloacimonadota bacterium]